MREEERAGGGEMREGERAEGGEMREEERDGGREVGEEDERGSRGIFGWGLCFASSLSLPSGAMVAYPPLICASPALPAAFRKMGKEGERDGGPL